MKSDNHLVSIIQGKYPGVGQAEFAWHELVESYNNIILDDCLRFWHGDHSAAEDSVQNTWIKTFNDKPGKGIDQYYIGTEIGDDNFCAWIRTVARRQCIDEYRKNRRVNVGDYIANPDVDPLTSAGRQQKKFAHRITYLSAPSLWGTDGHRDQSGQLEKGINKRQAEMKWLSAVVQSAEEEVISDTETIESKYRSLIEGFLSNTDVDFFLDYQVDNNPKSNLERKRFFDIKTRMLRNMIDHWISQGRRLEDLMNQHQLSVITRRFSRGQSKSLIFKEMGLSGLVELEEILESGSGLLLRALLDETPDV